MMTFIKQVLNEDEMDQFAGQVALLVQPGMTLFLQGELGVGKTTFTRQFIKELGFEGKVKSPTYTLVEPYLFGKYEIFHFDLYRLVDEKELELIGIRDYFAETSICLIEWPDKGGVCLPLPDMIFTFDFFEAGRRVSCSAESSRGKEVLKKLIQLERY